MKYKLLVFFIYISLFSFNVDAFNGNVKSNIMFACRDTCNLFMDMYSPNNIKNNKERTCIIYIFGGGFFSGSKSEKHNVDFCQALADSGIVVFSIDYRLGMKGVSNFGITNTKPMEKAIDIAVEDLYSATSYIISNSNKFGIDANKIIICGSSAGAITVLQADYYRANKNYLAVSGLPLGFKYAAVIPFAGAIFSHEGKPDYKNYAPAPTLFFHGTKDKLVIYKHIRFLNKGLFGTDDVAKQFDKYDFPYSTIRYVGMGHEIAEVPKTNNLSDICQFIRDYVYNKKHLKKNMWIKDSTLKQTSRGKIGISDMYK